MTTTKFLPIAFTVIDASSYSSLSRSRLYQLMRSGALASVRIGGRRMIRRADLDALYARDLEIEAPV